MKDFKVSASKPAVITIVALGIASLAACSNESGSDNTATTVEQTTADSSLLQDQWTSVNYHPKDRELTTHYPDGLGYNRHYVVLEARAPNPDSPMRGLRAEGNTSILFASEGEGSGMGPDNINYQHAAGVWYDDDGNMIFLYYAFAPPAEPHIWVARGFGKFVGLTGHGKWHWLWPDGWERPEIPEGYEYPNAYEFDWELPGEDAVDTPMGVIGTTLYADGEGDFRDRATLSLTEPPEWNLTRNFPNGTRLVQNWLEGSVVAAKEGSPLAGLTIVGQTTEAMEVGPDGTGVIVYQTGMMEFTAEDGSQIFMFGENRPPAAPRLWVTAATGRFEGLTGDGTWNTSFPDDWGLPETDAPSVSPWEFAWNLPGQ